MQHATIRRISAVITESNVIVMRADDDPLIRKRTFAAQDCADVVRLNCAARQICFDGDNN